MRQMTLIFDTLTSRIDQFRERPVTTEHHLGEYFKTLSKLEKNLVMSQDMFTVRGKRGRPVPVIVPADIKHVLDLLQSQEMRQHLGIHESPYLFASLTQPSE